MSISPEEAWQEEAYDRMVEAILRDHRDDIIDEFVAERLASFHKSHPLLSDSADRMLEEARRLRNTSISACLVFGSAAIEIAIRDCILRPLVFGLVNEDNMGELVADIVVSNQKFHKILFVVLKQYDVDIEKIKRIGSSRTVWEEIKAIRRARNQLVHDGEFSSQENAVLSIAIAEFVVERLYPLLRQQVLGA